MSYLGVRCTVMAELAFERSSGPGSVLLAEMALESLDFFNVELFFTVGRADYCSFVFFSFNFGIFRSPRARFSISFWFGELDLRFWMWRPVPKPTPTSAILPLTPFFVNTSDELRELFIDFFLESYFIRCLE